MERIFSSLETFSNGVALMFSAVGDVWYILLPPILWFLFYLLWEHHVQFQYLSKLKWTLLELVPPREIEKSPLPMESVFWGFAGVMKTLTVEEMYVKGELPVSFSLEIVGTEGKVQFFVRTQVAFRNLVESHFYAQYPDMEIVEAPDYTTAIPATIPNNEWDLWGCDFKFVRDDLYPIKTYKYFEESVTGKMIDPLAGMVETMAKLGPGEHIWYQLIVTPHVESWSEEKGRATIKEFLHQVEKERKGVIMGALSDFWDILVNIPTGLLGGEPKFASAEEAAEKEEAPIEFRLTPGEKKALEALENNMSKQQFRTKMRFIYLGRHPYFNKPHGVHPFIGAVKQFNDFNLNSLMPDSDFKTYANYVWTKARLRYRQRRLFRRYVDRDGDPGSSKIMLSSEELATIFHIPDMAVTSPMLGRVMAKRGGAPANLPLQDLE